MAGATEIDGSQRFFENHPHSQNIAHIHKNDLQNQKQWHLYGKKTCAVKWKWMSCSDYAAKKNIRHITSNNVEFTKNLGEVSLFRHFFPINKIVKKFEKISSNYAGCSNGNSCLQALS